MNRDRHRHVLLRSPLRRLVTRGGGSSLGKAFVTKSGSSHRTVWNGWRPKAFRYALSAIALASTACRLQEGGTPEGVLSYSRAMSSCGPADGPAVSIELSRTPFAPTGGLPPSIRIFLNQSIASLTPGSREISSTGFDAHVARFTSATEVESAIAGTLVVTRIRADTTIEGSLDAAFPSGAHVRQLFVAPWTHTNLLCG